VLPIVYLATGTHTGDLIGMPAADRHISVDVGHVADGQARERWGGLNMYALLTGSAYYPHPAELSSPAQAAPGDDHRLPGILVVARRPLELRVIGDFVN
jgi:hypothetical protein